MQSSFRRNPSRLLIICALCLVFLVGTVLGHLNADGSPSDRSFQAYTDRLFREEVSGNMLNLHYSIAYPEKQNITRPASTLGTVSTPDDNRIALYEEITEKLRAFDPAKLSEENRITLDMLLLYYKTQQRSSDFYLLEEYLSPSLGIQAQLPVLLAEYAFYQEQDIADYLNLLTSVPAYFESILEFEQQKADAGYFMIDATLKRIISQCQSFIKDPDSNYMLEVFADKLKDFGTISETEQKTLNASHKKILLNTVIPAYQRLIQGLLSLQGCGRPSQGLAHMQKGKEYYLYLLRSQVGSWTAVKDMQERLSEQITADMKLVQQMLKEQPSLLRKMKSSLDLPENTPTQMLEVLRERIEDDFPNLSEPDFETRYVHRSMEDYLSPAFYLTPPLDTGSPNIIYINPADQSSNLELFATLSHEGFPGHLYQTIYFQKTSPADIRTLITSSGYAEGWATYIESYGYQYAACDLDDPAATDYTRLVALNRRINLCIYSLLDIGIHYYGWGESQAARFLQFFGITDSHVVSEIFQYIVETPANYQKYCWGCLNFLDLKKEWEDALGDNFDLKSFHQNLLEIGPVQFPVLHKYMNERLQKQQKEVPVRTSRFMIISLIFFFVSVTVKKFLQFQQCSGKIFGFFLIKIIQNRHNHFFMENLMMEKCPFPLLRERNQHHTPVFFTSRPLYISLFDKMVDCNRQSPCRNRYRFRNRRHVFRLLYADCFHNMHVIYRYIFIFGCDQCPLFNIQNIFKQFYQHTVYSFV